jgi:hypothetical protein
MEALLTASVSGSDLPGASESLRLYYENELKNLVNTQQKSLEKTSMSHVIALTTLTATACAISLAFAPAGIAFGLLVLGAGLVARD